MRILGILLLSVCPLIIGLKASSVSKLRLLQLELIVMMISRIKQYISYETITKGEIITRLAQDISFKQLGFWQCDDVVKLVRDNTCLVIEKQDKQKLLSFFEELGTTDVAGQISFCELYSRMFKDSLSRLREVSATQQKLYCSLGGFAALFVAVVLI